jgi:hypothetical protein
MLYREIIAVCSEIHTQHINTAVWAERRIVNVKLVVHIVTTGALKWGCCELGMPALSNPVYHCD